MLKAIFTLDYEIHGNGEGCPRELMVEPTQQMLDQFDRYGAKLTIMADVAEILKFKEYKERTGRDDFHYDAIASQLKDAVRRGHDVQLHLHASYFNARYEGGRWLQDWSEYNFAALPFERMNELVCSGEKYLEQLLKPVAPTYRCFVFRAANWSVSPSLNVSRALVNNDIRVETSVFKHGRREGIVSFDYTNAHSDLIPWRADENDFCREDPNSPLIEAPIYCERRWIGAFVSLNRIYRAYLTRKHSVISTSHTVGGDKALPRARKKPNFAKLALPFRRHAWKADFNQCSGRQLIRALQRAARKHQNGNAADYPFVLIGHSKLFTQHNERSLEPFLKFILQQKSRFGFATFGDFDFTAQEAR